MSGPPPSLEEKLALLDLLEDRADRIEALISFADQFREVPAEIATRPYPEEARVPGCESEAYVWVLDRPDGTLDLHFAVENPQGVSAMALAVLLQQTLSGLPPEQVVGTPEEIVYRIFGRELSMGKSMGLTGMVSMVRRQAEDRLS